ncbi:MAG: hypothetical protein H7228_08430 [Polaromonas sp.]|nr:hypothetical protein [Polaromonas sp.]
MKKSKFILSGFLLLAAMDSMAVSLGRHRGTALIGRPLDIAVQATLDAEDDIPTACLGADVFFADNKLDGSRVRVTAERTGSSAQDVLIRIRSTTLVDEPVVMIYLRAGCQRKSERQYVLLADLISEPDTPLVTSPGFGVIARSPLATASPRTSQATNAGKATSGLSVGAPAGISASAAARVNPPVASASKPLAAKSERRTKAVGALAADPSALDARKPPSTTASPVAQEAAQLFKATPPLAKTTKTTEKGRARLKLDPLDLTIDRNPELKVSRELLSVPAGSEQERSAAAALWRALTTQPQDILRDVEKVQALEVAVRNLQAQSQRNQLAINELNVQLRQAEASRYANFLVYLLGFLLLVALAALAYLWRQRVLLLRTEDNELPWWKKNKPSEKGWADSGRDVVAVSPANEVESADKGLNKTKKTPRVALDFDLSLGVDKSSFTEVKHLSGHGATDSMSPFSVDDSSDFVISLTHLSRAVKAEELFDVQQQADFFISLGQYEQAIEVLRGHIGDNVDTSALVYLDLVNLYHQLNREADYEALREDFNKRFNAKIPSFELYSNTSPGLESYQSALSRIEALWPSPKVLDVIEESIFRKPDANTEAFDLGAYRELLLLYAVAKEIIGPEANRSSSLPKFDLPHSVHDDYDVKTTKFVSTAIQPLSASVNDGKLPDALPRGETDLLPEILPDLLKSSSRMGLDVDLSDVFGGSEGQNFELETDSHFFEQFATSEVGAVTGPAPLTKTPAQDDAAVGNLIDFDSFDSAMDSVERKKRPKV